MKHALIILALTFSTGAFANNKPVTKTAAPTDKQANTALSDKEKYHSYDNTDTIKTNQSATARDHRKDARACRDSSGTWLKSGDVGYAACLDSNTTTKK